MVYERFSQIQILRFVENEPSQKESEGVIRKFKLFLEGAGEMNFNPLQFSGTFLKTFIVFSHNSSELNSTVYV